MALIVEDGTGLPNSEAFCSVAFADTHHANRGMTNWATLSVPEKEQAIRRAADYMQQTYRMRWNGYRTSDSQAMDFPRIDMPRESSGRSYFGNLGSVGSYQSYYPSNIVPVEVQQANADLALKAAAGELLADIGQLVKEKQIGPLRTVFQDNSRPVKRYLAIDRLLAPFMCSANTLKVMRA